MRLNVLSGSRSQPTAPGKPGLGGGPGGHTSGFDLPAQLAYAAAAGAANAARADVARIGPEDIRPLVGAVTVAPAP